MLNQVGGISMNKKSVIVIGSIILCFLICCVYQFKYQKELNYDCNEAETNMEIAAELCDGVVFEQIMTRPIEKIAAISINVPTFHRQDIDGILEVEVYSDGQNVATVEKDASTIQDGEEVRIDFKVKEGHVGEELRIVISTSGSAGRSVGLWIGTASDEEILKPYAVVNGEKIIGTLNDGRNAFSVIATNPTQIVPDGGNDDLTLVYTNLANNNIHTRYNGPN